MKLYTGKLPPNPRRVNIFIAEKGLGDRIEMIELDLATQAKQPDHLARHPQGLVPVLELDDGRFLTESRAICSYLEHLVPEPNLLGETPEERAFIEMFDRRIEFGVLMPLAQWVRHGHPGLAVLEKPQVPDYAAASQAKAREAMAWLNDDLAKRTWVAGERFTIADITCFAAIEFARIVKFRAWEDHEHIARWRSAMLARPAVAAN
jgi:glutathione S-transferase